MQITIGTKEYNFKFGVAFIAALDKAFTTTVEGVTFGVGLEQTLPQVVNMRNVTKLVEYLKFANETEKLKVSVKDIQDYIDGLSMDEYEALYDSVIAELEASTVVGSKMKALNGTAK